MSDSKQAITLRVPLILWASMLTRHLVIVGVGMFLRQQAAPEPVANLQILSLALTGAGAPTALSSAPGSTRRPCSVACS